MSVATPIYSGETIVGVICHEPMTEVLRRPNGAPRWCFHCRAQRDFDYVVTAPTETSYYGPNPSIRCTTCNTDDGDCFPGRYRTWGEDD